MLCKDFSKLQGCTNCICPLSNTANISKLDSYSIIDLLDQLIEVCYLFPDTKPILSKSTIDCTGNVSIGYEAISTENKLINMNYIYYIVLSKWLKLNISKVRESINILYLVLCASIINYNEQDQKALSLLDNLKLILNYIYNYLQVLEKKD